MGRSLHLGSLFLGYFCSVLEAVNPNGLDLVPTVGMARPNLMSSFEASYSMCAILPGGR